MRGSWVCCSVAAHDNKIPLIWQSSYYFYYTLKPVWGVLNEELASPACHLDGEFLIYLQANDPFLFCMWCLVNKINTHYHAGVSGRGKKTQIHGIYIFFPIMILMWDLWRKMSFFKTCSFIINSSVIKLSGVKYYRVNIHNTEAGRKNLYDWYYLALVYVVRLLRYQKNNN